MLLVLHTLEATCLILNQMIGWSIFVLPSFVAVLLENKTAAAIIWPLGGLYTLLCAYINLEYAAAWPFNGGEFIYISRMFRYPPLLLMCSFAWFFVAFSTPAGSSLVFAQQIVPRQLAQPNAWRTMYIASALTAVISWIHYRHPRIGLFANWASAAAKISFLVVMICAGLIRAVIDTHSIPPFDEFRGHSGENSTAYSKAVAVLLVLYSYHGWQAATYVTSEIYGGEETHDDECSQRRVKSLKSSTYLAVCVVTVIYSLFNWLLLWMFDFETMKNHKVSMTALLAMKAFGTSRMEDTACSISFCIATCAFGNVVSVLYTNKKVIRKIAWKRLIPYYATFQASSTYGRSKWDEKGTPRGALLLVTLITHVTTWLIFLRPVSEEVPFFISSIFTYGHSIVGILLGSGFLQHYREIHERRLRNEEMACTTPHPDDRISRVFHVAFRWFAGGIFLLGNIFVLVMPFFSVMDPRAYPWTLPTWILPLALGVVCSYGAFAAIYILSTCSRIWFDDGRRDSRVFQHKRGWMLEFPNINLTNFWIPHHPGALRERFALREESFDGEHTSLVSQNSV
ncbi:hypothetical protein K432DRAFT_464940 [Lepidopterella palustris CBS 459.81]|uniref:Amino acid transporter n=1 Tax=Lepidopterella palustris CBS 459.81 TaxID=1314670 RepID=A0A8E2JAU7_9PEZI|nr:hypothetical protein K432DRAFT_464940 [Lepidopterella palustris CBS 459.81]